MCKGTFWIFVVCLLIPSKLQPIFWVKCSQDYCYSLDMSKREFTACTYLYNAAKIWDWCQVKFLTICHIEHFCLNQDFPRCSQIQMQDTHLWRNKLHISLNSTNGGKYLFGYSLHKLCKKKNKENLRPYVQLLILYSSIKNNMCLRKFQINKIYYCYW